LALTALLLVLKHQRNLQLVEEQAAMLLVEAVVVIAVEVEAKVEIEATVA
jgi:hypothetical protein